MNAAIEMMWPVIDPCVRSFMKPQSLAPLQSGVATRWANRLAVGTEATVRKKRRGRLFPNESVVPSYLAAQGFRATDFGFGIHATLLGRLRRLGDLANLRPDQRLADQVCEPLQRLTPVLLLRAVVPGNDLQTAVIGHPAPGERAQALFRRPVQRC